MVIFKLLTFVGISLLMFNILHTGKNHFEVLKFTRDLPTFKSFVAKITAEGGGDVPEDVIGGLNRAISLTWPEKSGGRILFHLADAPPHGKGTYHNFKDDYPNGHPSDKPLESLFAHIRKKSERKIWSTISGASTTSVTRWSACSTVITAQESIPWTAQRSL